MEKKSLKDRTPSSVFKVGAIALAFMILGYQSALFVQRAAVLRIESLRDRPDTVYVFTEAEPSPGSYYKNAPAFSKSLGNDSASAAAGSPESLRPHDTKTLARFQNRPEALRSFGSSHPASSSCHPERSEGSVVVRRNAVHSPAVERVRRRTRRVESFRFDPNTVSVEDLMRLGFSEKQAQAIDAYRQKGGRFRRPSDFAKSYVVADSVFDRLAPFIDIPRLDINRADSAAFDGLPGIGPYYAAKMVEYRERLGGYSFKEQLMDIWKFDRERYDGLSDLIVCSRPARPFRLWQMPEDSLRLHPYIRSWQAAHSIVLYRSSMPRDAWTVEGIASAGILPPEDAAKLARCLIAEP